jgi:hypothetical protein
MSVTDCEKEKQQQLSDAREGTDKAFASMRERIAQLETAIAWLLSPEGADKHAWWRSMFKEKAGL